MAAVMTIEEALRLSPPGQRALRYEVNRVVFERQETVIHKGQAVSGAYIVLSGQLRVYTFNPNGTEATLYLIRSGETCVLALNCLFNDLRYPAWVEADAGTEVAVIPGNLYRQLFKDEPGVQDMTIKALSTVVFRLMEELEQIHTSNLDQRLANFLLNNARSDGVVRMTQQTLARHLGTTREVVARIMQGFSARGLVATRRGEVSIIDEVGLGSIVTLGL